MKPTVKRRGNFLGWPCVRVYWRWNAHVMLWGFAVRVGNGYTRWTTLKACHVVANDVSAWWSR